MIIFIIQPDTTTYEATLLHPAVPAAGLMDKTRCRATALYPGLLMPYTPIRQTAISGSTRGSSLTHLRYRSKQVENGRHLGAELLAPGLHLVVIHNTSNTILSRQKLVIQ